MTSDHEIRDDLYQAALEPNTLEGRVILLTERVRVLTREVERSNRRTSKLEVAYQRGFGMFLVFPFLGALMGFIATYWSTLFKPWSK